MIGKILFHYEIKKELGSGGMGHVYLAQDTKLDRTVALKILPSDVASDPERMRRFVQEAKAASALDHPNVAQIYEIGESDGTNFIAMQYVEGQTLDALSKGHQLDSKEITDIAIQIADALDAASAKGITHRDIKAANIMLTPRGQVKVLDFGLAKIEQKATSQPEASKLETATGTTPGMIVGTVQYMSPEQALGKPVDNRSDIYSLGVVLYQLATSRLPFSGETPSDTLNRILNAQPEAIARFNYNIDPELERIIRKCMEKDPERRYQSARELLIDLKNLKRDSESGHSTSNVRASQRHARGRRGAPALLWLAGILLLLGLAAGIFYYLRNARGSDIRSLAVLPFANVNGNPNEEWLSDGITENTINSLSQLPELKVMARSTVFRYKNQNLDPQKIGNELKVDAVLTGTMNEKGNDLVVNAELVNVRDGSQIWGHQYNRKTSDIMQVQKELSQDISEKLRSKLTGEEKQKISKDYTQNAKAYQLYMKGRYHWNKRTGDGIKKGIEYFQQAIDLDPTFALAYAGLADSYLINSAPFSPEERLLRGKAAAEKSYELDPLLAEAQASMGATKEEMWEWDEAEKFYRKALLTNPNYATAHQWLGELLAHHGKFDEAIAEGEKAIELDPLSLIINTSLGTTYYLARDYDLAIQQSIKTIELFPNSTLPYPTLIDSYAQKKMIPEVFQAEENLLRAEGAWERDKEKLEKVRQIYLKSGEKAMWKEVLDIHLESYQRGDSSPWDIAQDYANVGDRDQTIQWLQKSVAARDPGIGEIMVKPKFDKLHSDPRFQELLRKMNLVKK
jgi:eukaryotic-like serine/threonine-protein kinase